MEHTEGHTKEFIEQQKRELERMRDELREALEMETEEFNEVFRRLSTKDFPEIGEELADHRSIGMIEIADRERMRSIASALYRIDHGQYGICTACRGTIDKERLQAKPDAALCISCKKRLEQENT